MSECEACGHQEDMHINVAMVGEDGCVTQIGTDEKGAVFCDCKGFKACTKSKGCGKPCGIYTDIFGEGDVMTCGELDCNNQLILCIECEKSEEDTSRGINKNGD